jgi:hypothetical protein
MVRVTWHGQVLAIQQGWGLEIIILGEQVVSLPGQQQLKCYADQLTNLGPPGVYKQCTMVLATTQEDPM